MGRENRAAETIIGSKKIDSLLNKGKTYQFFQALRLLELSKAVNSESDVRIRPSLNLSFPGNDIESIERTKDGKYLITANFFGLYGVTSPLPTFHTEDLIREMLDGKSSMRDFLDIIHAQYYPLLFSAWKKNRLWLSIDENQVDNNNALNYLLSFVGLSYKDDDDEQTKIENRSLVAFAGLFSSSFKSVAGLQTLLSGLLNGINVEVKPCIADWAIIPKNACFSLGEQANQLGENSILGGMVKQRRNRFDVIIGPLVESQFKLLSTNNRKFNFLLRSIKQYCSSHYSFRVKFLITRAERKPLSLGQGWQRLGVDTWLDTDKNFEFLKKNSVMLSQYNIVTMATNQAYSENQ